MHESLRSAPTYLTFSCRLAVSMRWVTIFPTNCFLKRQKINYASNLLPTIKHAKVRNDLEVFFKLSTHVLDRRFPRSLFCSDTRMDSGSHRSGSREAECTARSFLRKNRACSGTRWDACNSLAGDRNSFYTAGRRKGLHATLHERVFNSV